MSYVKIQNGQVATYPYNMDKFRSENRNVSFPATLTDKTLASYNVYKVVEEVQPSYNPDTQKVTLATTPILVGGVWTLTWTVSNKSQDQLDNDLRRAERDNRIRRDSLLAETDWWASSDLTMTAEQTAYRQALRDITTHANWPHLSESDWPVKP